MNSSPISFAVSSLAVAHPFIVPAPFYRSEEFISDPERLYGTLFTSSIVALHILNTMNVFCRSGGWFSPFL